MFGIADGILIAGFDDLGRDHDSRFYKVLRICRQANLKFNKDKCLFWCTNVPFFGEVILQSGVSRDPRKVWLLTTIPPLKCKKELQSFLGIVNYLSKFSPMTAEVCEALWKLTWVKLEWSWNRVY